MSMYRYRKVTTLSLVWRNCGQLDRGQFLHQTGNYNKILQQQNKQGCGGHSGVSETCHNPTIPFREEEAGLRSHDSQLKRVKERDRTDREVEDCSEAVCFSYV